jgi:hypothetical protein
MKGCTLELPIRHVVATTRLLCTELAEKAPRTAVVALEKKNAQACSLRGDELIDKGANITSE